VGESRPIRFVSDVHLPPEGAAGRRGTRGHVLDRWTDFLEDAAARCAVLYVLGDLFGFWYESGGRPPPGFDRALRAMREAVSRGLRIAVLHGNRDFLLGAAFTRASGAELLPEEVHVTLGGKRICLTHGDILAADDHRYQIWRRLSRGGTFRRVAGGTPSPVAGCIARLLRLGSEFEKSVKPRGLMSYSESVLRGRIAGGADVIVAGHVHEADERVIEAGGRKGRLLVLGHWDERRGAYAEWAGGELRLVR
jgi:UDP-2,3-diacylglucosamine hydrolase